MRFSEFIAMPENTASEDAFKALMMLLRQNANDEKEGSTISWDAIKTFMNKVSIERQNFNSKRKIFV